MFFLCFSGQDRLSVAQSILYHLEKYGLQVWYDNHEYLLGDKKIESFTQAIHESRYAIVILSPDFPNSPGAIEELDVIKHRYDAGQIYVFPIFFRLQAKDVPPEYQWLNNLIYNEIDESTGSLLTCNQIVCKYFSDLLAESEFKTIQDILRFRDRVPTFCEKAVENYYDIVPANINSRLSLLYSLFLYFETICELPKYLVKTAHYLFLTTKLDLSYNFKEIILMEQVVCLATSCFIKNSRQRFGE